MSGDYTKLQYTPRVRDVRAFDQVDGVTGADVTDAGEDNRMMSERSKHTNAPIKRHGPRERTRPGPTRPR